MRRIALIRIPARTGLLLLVGWLMLGCGSSESPLPPVPPAPTSVTAVAATNPTAPAEGTVTPTPLPADTATPAATARPAGTADAPPGSIELKTAVVKLDRDGTPSVLNKGEEMAACAGPDGDCFPVYGMYFSPNQAAFIYAFQRDSTGKIDTLFPNQEYSEQENPVPTNQVVWVPKDPNYWFNLDDNVGQETIYVVAGLERINELEKLTGHVQGDAGGSTDATAQLVTWLEDKTRGVGGVKRQVVSVRLPGPKPEEVSLEVLVVEAIGENRFVYQVTFQHVASGVLQ